MAKPKQTINTFYDNKFMKASLDSKIKDFAKLTGLPGETYPIMFTSNILESITEAFNKGTTEEKIEAKRNLGEIWMNDSEYFIMDPKGEVDFIDTKNKIYEQYGKALPLIHKEHGAKVVDKSIEPLQELVKKYKDLVKVKDDNKRKQDKAQLDFNSGHEIYQLYGQILDNKHINNLNKLQEARKNKDMDYLAKVVGETTKEIGGVYHELILNQVLSSERRMNTFIGKYEQLTIDSLAKDYTNDKGLNVEKVKKDLYSSLGKDMNKYPTLVNYIAAIAQQKAAEKAKKAKKK